MYGKLSLKFAKHGAEKAPDERRAIEDLRLSTGFPVFPIIDSFSNIAHGAKVFFEGKPSILTRDWRGRRVEGYPISPRFFVGLIVPQEYLMRCEEAVAMLDSRNLFSVAELRKKHASPDDELDDHITQLRKQDRRTTFYVPPKLLGDQLNRLLQPDSYG